MLGPSLRPFPGCVRACARLCTLAGLSSAGGRASAATQHNSPPAAATYLPCCGRRTFVLLLASLEERPPLLLSGARWEDPVQPPLPRAGAGARRRQELLPRGGWIRASSRGPPDPRAQGRRGSGTAGNSPRSTGGHSEGSAPGGPARGSQAPRALASLRREAGVRQGPRLQAGRHH